MTDPLLAQYAVLSERGLHFGRLFWQSIAFHLVMLIGAAAVIRGGLTRQAMGVALDAAGLATILMAFVVWRLWITEQKYEALLNAIEEELRGQGIKGIQTSPPSGRRGARFVVILTLGALGVILGVLGFSALALPAD